MKNILIAFLLLACVGCERDRRQVIVKKPEPKVTKTITETEKVETPVPVYEIKTSITSKTRTVKSDGTAAAPLHETKVKTPGPAEVLPEPK